MKKRIILIAITVLTLALLSGCDAILEGFFPEFADTNSIDVHVKMPGHYNVITAPVVVALIPYDGASLDTGNAVLQARHELDFYVTFDGLPEGKYKVYTWHDTNNNWTADDAAQAKGYANILGSSVEDFLFDSGSFEGDFYTGICDLTLKPDEAPPAGL